MRRLPWVLVLSVASAIVCWAESRTNHLDFKKKPPYVTGKAPQVPTVLAHHFRVGSSFGEPGRDAELAASLEGFLQECERFVTDHGISKRLEAPALAGHGDLPHLYVGHPDGFWAPSDAWSDTDLEAQGRSVVAIAVTDPPTRLTKQLSAPLNAMSATHMLYVTLELSDYAVAQKNWKGSKAVELGTGHIMPVPWLTSLDQLAEVLQFEGVLYRADGRFVRAGAEAFHAQRTPFRQAILNVQRTMQPEELQEALRATRTDLPDQPLAWQVALRNLLGQLTGRVDLLTTP